MVPQHTANPQSPVAPLRIGVSIDTSRCRGSA
jgi:hypothetical protein